MAREYRASGIVVPSDMPEAERRRVYVNEYQRAWRRRHKDEPRFKEMRKQAAKRDRTKNATKIKARARRYNYGLTEDEYMFMEASQGGRCKICGHLVKLVVDHCHRTGRIRGLLCTKCNVGLGAFGDEPSTLEVAASYLRAGE